ncbi:hypothetical protein KAX75_09150 [candidate division WOR-3 bacterium]|nr:hypothetical protein [candidate division WOR-3 bacterium]
MGEEEKKIEEPTEPTPSGGDVSGGLKALFIILAILFPLIGVILGIVWITKKTKEEKALGKLTLIIGIIMIVLWCICSLVAMFGFGIIGSMGDYSILLPLISVA